MHRFKFEDDDLFINRLKTYPEYNVFIYQGVQYTNKFKPLSGSGGLTVFDINSGRTTNLIQPHVTASLRKDIFKNQVYNPLVNDFTGERFNTSRYWHMIFGDALSTYPDDGTAIVSSYPYASPIKRAKQGPTAQPLRYWNLETGRLVNSGETTNLINATASALQNVARKYTVLSNHFIFESSSVRSRNLLHEDINFINIPQMYYGSSIKKGSVKLEFFLTGSKIAECSDQYENGILTETTGTAVGNVVGLVLYDEGIIMLTASHGLEDSSHPIGVRYDGTNTIESSWLYFATGLNDNQTHTSLSASSYNLTFKGVSYVNTMTMLAHAKRGHLNHSNNPTYRDLSGVRNIQTGSGITFAEGEGNIKNIVSASFSSASFEKTTYISKINLYDENENLIGVASLATPVKKTLDREYLFKLKLDI